MRSLVCPRAPPTKSNSSARDARSRNVADRISPLIFVNTIKSKKPTNSISRLSRRGAIRTAASDLFLQLRHALEQVGQLLQSDHLAFGRAVRLGGRPKPFLTIRNVVHDSGLRGDGYAVANLQVSGHPN